SAALPAPTTSTSDRSLAREIDDIMRLKVFAEASMHILLSGVEPWRLSEYGAPSPQALRAPSPPSLSSPSPPSSGGEGPRAGVSPRGTRLLKLPPPQPLTP